MTHRPLLLTALGLLLTAVSLYKLWRLSDGLPEDARCMCGWRGIPLPEAWEAR